MSKIRNIESLPLDGGLLCLDFTNTVQNRKKSGSLEYLENYTHFLEWCLKVKIATPDEISNFRQIAEHSPASAIGAYHHIILTRELLYKLFSAKAAGESIDEEVLARYNELLSEALRHIGFKNAVDGLEEVWMNPDNNIVAPLWKVLKSTYEILTSPEVKYVKECSACGWLFLDKSRTHTRRWCNPLECGSVDKATRYYHRQKAKKKQA
ncbi:CGNR zinc finger domain-containing protein [Mucilaginibacter lutimaris]|uniref:CGNR zinc finger domain-containing protein n=1 Tax=Mucilaginibacter lutimaris TaxID=931629 RepID=A0ABW2ZK96_9SPHI